MKKTAKIFAISSVVAFAMVAMSCGSTAKAAPKAEEPAAVEAPVAEAPAAEEAPAVAEPAAEVEAPAAN